MKKFKILGSVAPGFQQVLTDFTELCVKGADKHS